MGNRSWGFYGHRHDEPIGVESDDILERIKDWADEHKALPLGVFLTEIANEIEELRWMLSHAVYCPSKICHICDLIEEEVRYDKTQD
jgi:hypothetical protein